MYQHGQSKRLMCLPSSGGPPVVVLTAAGDSSFRCAHTASGGCVLAEWDGPQLSFHAFSPRQGRLHELGRIQTDGVHYYSWSLSPNGQLIALTRDDDRSPVIQVLSLTGALVREIVLKGRVGLNHIEWAPSGDALYVSSSAFTGATLLRTDLKGRWRELWHQEAVPQTWAIPSPSGRYLAILGSTAESNMWLVDGLE
jgi:hypothetical protein